MQGTATPGTVTHRHEYRSVPGTNTGTHNTASSFIPRTNFCSRRLSEYIGNALRGQDAAIVVATDAHRNGLLQWLTVQGLDVAALIERGRLVVMDAAQLLAAFMLEGSTKEDRFNEVVGGVIAKALACAGGEQPRVAIFGKWWHCCGQMARPTPRSGVKLETKFSYESGLGRRRGVKV